MQQLGRAPQRAGPDYCVRGEFVETFSDQRIARVFALGHGGEHQAGRQFGGQIFQAMYRQIGAAGQQGLLDFFREQSLAAYFRQGHIGNLVACRLDDVDPAFVARAIQTSGHPSSLPDSELRTAGSDDEHTFFHREPQSWR